MTGPESAPTSVEAQAIHDHAQAAAAERDLADDPEPHYGGCWCCCWDCDFDFEAVCAADRIAGIEGV